MDKILVSACLMGEKCRYDGKDNLIDTIGELRKHYDLVPFCPEVEAGLPTPRKPSEIYRDQVIRQDGENVTKYFMLGAEKALNICKFLGIRIAILKEGSPSCGVKEIHDGRFSGKKVKGQGFTARLLIHNGIKVYSENDILSALLPSPQDQENKEKKKLENVEKAKERVEKAALLKKYTEDCEAATAAGLPLPEKPAALVEMETRNEQSFEKKENRFDRPFHKDGYRKPFGHHFSHEDGEHRSFHKDGDHPYHEGGYEKKSYGHSSYHHGEEGKTDYSHSSERKYEGNKPYGDHSHEGGEKPYSPRPYGKFGDKKPYGHSYHEGGERKPYGEGKPYGEHSYHKYGDGKPVGEHSHDGEVKTYEHHSTYHKYGEGKPYSSHPYLKDGPSSSYKGGYEKKEYGHGEGKPSADRPFHKYGEKPSYGNSSFHKDGTGKSYGSHSFHKDGKTFGGNPHRSFNHQPGGPKGSGEKK